MAIEVKIGAYQAYAIAKERGFEGTEEEWLDTLQGSSVQSVKVSSDGNLIFSVKNPKTGEEKELDPVNVEELAVIEQIMSAKDLAISNVQSAQNSSIFNLNTAKQEAIVEINETLTEAQQQIEQSKDATIISIQQDGKIVQDGMKEEIQTFVSQLNDEIIEAINTVKDSSLDEINQTKTEAVQSVNDLKSEAVKQASEEINVVAQTTVDECKNEILDITSQFTAEANREISSTKESSILEISNVTTQKLEEVSSDIEDAKVLTINEFTRKQEEIISSIDESLINAKQEINTAVDEAIELASDSIDEFETSVKQEITEFKTDSIGEINTAAVEAKKQAVNNAQTEISTIKDQVLKDISDAEQSTIEAVSIAVENVKNDTIDEVENIGAEQSQKLENLIPDVYTKKESDQRFAQIKSLYEQSEMSGSIVSFEPLENSVLNTTIQIEPVQEGTGDPSPENVRPISGWDTVNVWRGGKNLFDDSIVSSYEANGISVDYDPTDHTFTLNGTATNIHYKPFYKLFAFAKNKQFKVSVNVVSGNINVPDGKYAVVYFGAGNTLSEHNNYISNNLDKTIGSGLASVCKYKYITSFWFYIEAGVVCNNLKVKIQLELGDTETDYEPYRGKTFTIPLGQDVYGGTLDAAGGTLTVDRVLKTLNGSEKWYLDYDELKSLYWHSIILTGADMADISQIYKAISSHFKNKTNEENGFWISSSGNNIRVSNNMSTSEEWKEYLISESSAGHPVQMAYYIATPITVQLTPAEIYALSGLNTIYADTGDIQVKFLSTNEIYAKIEDSKLSSVNAWSSESIVSRICPPFEVSGSVVTCNPVEGSRLGMIIQIEPVQEGEENLSPENIRPIQGWDSATIWHGGKNLLGEDLPALDGFIDNASDAIVSSTSQGKTYVVPIKKYGTFTVSVNKTQIIRLATCAFKPYLGASLSTITTATSTYRSITSNSSDRYLLVNLPRVDFGADEPMLVYGDESSYEPYCGKMIEIPFGQTVYGGTLDVESGTLIVTHANMTLTGELPWKTYNNGNEGLSFYFENEDFKEGLQTSICSHYKNVDFSWTSTNANKYGIYGDHSITNTKYFRPPDKDVTTLELFKEWLDDQKEAGTPVQIMYKLAEPITIQLTPQEIYALSGINTIYADTGDVTVSGYSDPTAIINSLADRIAALEQNAIGG